MKKLMKHRSHFRECLPETGGFTKNGLGGLFRARPSRGPRVENVENDMGNLWMPVAAGSIGTNWAPY